MPAIVYCLIIHRFTDHSWCDCDHSWYDCDHLWLDRSFMVWLWSFMVWLWSFMVWLWSFMAWLIIHGLTDKFMIQYDFFVKCHEETVIFIDYSYSVIATMNNRKWVRSSQLWMITNKCHHHHELSQMSKVILTMNNCKWVKSSSPWTNKICKVIVTMNNHKWLRSSPPQMIREVLMFNLDNEMHLNSQTIPNKFHPESEEIFCYQKYFCTHLNCKDSYLCATSKM